MVCLLELNKACVASNRRATGTMGRMGNSGVRRCERGTHGVTEAQLEEYVYAVGDCAQPGAFHAMYNS